MRTLFLFFLLFCFFFLCFVRLFYCHIYILFFHKSAAKTRYNTRVSKKFSSVCHRFSSLTSTSCLTHLGTSNAKTHNTKVVGLIFLFLSDIWIAYFGKSKWEIFTPKYRLVQNFRITKRFISNTNNSLIPTLSGNLVNMKDVDNF
jgi:hypothetical protein